MITRTIAGMAWRFACPSYLEPIGYPQVSVVYLGDTEPSQWFIQCERREGHPEFFPCPSRDTACDIVARGIAGART